MIPTISTSHFRRPDYTAATLRALGEAAGSRKYRLVCCVDVVDEQSADPRVLSAIAEQTWPAEMIISEMDRHGGANRTIRDALRIAFEHSDSDYVIHIEDDVKVGWDALAWFEWAGERYRYDPSVFTVTDWRHKDGWQPNSKRRIRPDEAAQCQREEFFTCWGWATWRDRWEEMLEHWTTGDDYSLSWDVRLSELRADRVQIAPMISRAVNIGELLGTHRGRADLPFWRGTTDQGNIPSFYEVDGAGNAVMPRSESVAV